MADISQKAFYSSNDIASKLDISESTLRKYSYLLEQYSWTFTKTERGARTFSDEDLELLKMFLKFRNEMSMSVEKSSDIAVSYFKRNVSLTRDVSPYNNSNLTPENQNNIVQEFRHNNQELNNKIEKISDGQDKLLEKLDSVLDENETLRKELKERENKGFFQKLFGKDTNG